MSEPLQFGLAKALATGRHLVLRFRVAATGIGPLWMRESVDAPPRFQPWPVEPEEAAAIEARQRRWAIAEAFEAYNSGAVA